MEAGSCRLIRIRVYQRRCPERTVEYQLVRQNWETWLVHRHTGYKITACSGVRRGHSVTPVLVIVAQVAGKPGAGRICHSSIARPILLVCRAMLYRLGSSARGLGFRQPNRVRFDCRIRLGAGVSAAAAFEAADCAHVHIAGQLDLAG